MHIRPENAIYYERLAVPQIAYQKYLQYMRYSKKDQNYNTDDDNGFNRYESK